MFREEKEQLKDLQGKLAELRGYLDVEAKEERVAELEAEIARPGFWDQGDAAQEVLKERTSLQKIIAGWNDCNAELEDLLLLVELGEESDDQATLTEICELLPDLERRVGQMEFARMLSGEHDANNAIFSINAGAGGTEAQDWADMLLRMYLRFCEKKGYKTEMTDYQPGDEAGVKGVTFTVEGDYAYGWLRAEMGIHRLVRISPFDSNAKRHTSFSSVFVFPELSDDIEVEINDKDLKVDTFRASGAGGQHINKTDSAIRITHVPSGIIVACQSERSQHKNRSTAMKQLKARLYEQERLKKEEEAAVISGNKMEIGWGSQIRSYVLHPYRMVKDHRTGYETGNTDAVLDGDLQGFIEAYLLSRS
ncbi:MAG: peptide chain release factor 2 [Desulfuromonadales bacterium]|nr:peptide chain release factor 2 [Desulfuromonadales bacterium]MDT8423622.1 peptide chain release factor 2 [Desulfuromonadales bacterium]